MAKCKQLTSLSFKELNAMLLWTFPTWSESLCIGLWLFLSAARIETF